MTSRSHSATENKPKTHLNSSLWEFRQNLHNKNEDKFVETTSTAVTSDTGMQKKPSFKSLSQTVERSCSAA